MKSIRIALPILAVFALSAAAEEIPQLTMWMKTAGAALGALSKAEKKTGPQAVAGAERLGAVYENMIPFWRGRNAANAVKWSEEGKAAAVELASAANAGKEEEAAAALKTLSGTCHNCHEAYREKLPDGGYRIK
jgi:cytochrome c556